MKFDMNLIVYTQAKFSGLRDYWNLNMTIRPPSVNNLQRERWENFNNDLEEIPN